MGGKMFNFKENLKIGGITRRGFLYSVDNGEVQEYKGSDACKLAARIIDKFAYSKIYIEHKFEKDDHRKYLLPPPPPEHEFDVSEHIFYFVVIERRERFNRQTFQRLPEMFLKLLPDEVLEHLLATDKQREFITELSIVAHLVPEPYRDIFIEASKSARYKYLTKNEASWYISRMLYIIREWEKIYIEPAEEPVSP